MTGWIGKMLRRLSLRHDVAFDIQTRTREIESRVDRAKAERRERRLRQDLEQLKKIRQERLDGA